VKSSTWEDVVLISGLSGPHLRLRKGLVFKVAELADAQVGDVAHPEDIDAHRGSEGGGRGGGVKQHPRSQNFKKLVNKNAIKAKIGDSIKP